MSNYPDAQDGYERGTHLCPDDRLEPLATLYQTPVSELSPVKGLEDDALLFDRALEFWPEGPKRAQVIELLLEDLERYKKLIPPK